MNEFYIVLKQLIQLFIIFGIGAWAMKQSIITDRDLPFISRLIGKVLIPIFIYMNIIKEGSFTKLVEYFPALYLSILVYGLLIVIFYAIAKLAKFELNHSRVFQGVFIFINVGFIGFPIMFSLYPQDGPLYVAWITLVDQFLLWTYGVFLTSGQKQFKLMQMFNPPTYALILAIITIALGIKPPELISKALWNLSSTATPLCMVYMGAMFYLVKPFWVLKSWEVYVGIGVKMVLLPLLIGLGIHNLDLPASMKGTFIVLAALPPMILIPMIVPETSKEKPFAIGATLVGIVACLFTIPLVLYLHHLLVG